MLCLPIIQRLYRKSLLGIQFPPIKTAGDVIIDGHHRYVSALLAGIPIHCIPSVQTDAIVLVEWSKVIFDINDWDTVAKIKLLNQQDARHNGLSVAALARLLE